MTEQAPEGWERLGDGFVKPSIRGPLWRISPTAVGWRLLRDADPGLDFDITEGLTLAVADTPERLAARSGHIDAHSLKVEAWLARHIMDERPGPHGLRMISRKPAGDRTLSVQAVMDGDTIGDRAISLEGHEAIYVLGEDVISGSTFLVDEWIGKGVALALYEIGEELTGLRSTPHGRFGAGGILSDQGADFWRKRRERQSVPGDADAEGVARRLAEIESVYLIQWAERSGFLDVQVAVALARAIDGQPAVVVAPDGNARGWAIAPDGRAFTTRGWDSVPGIETRRGRLRKGWEAAEGHAGVLSAMSISKRPSLSVAKVASIALNLHHSPGWTPESVMARMEGVETEGVAPKG